MVTFVCCVTIAALLLVVVVLSFCYFPVCGCWLVLGLVVGCWLLVWLFTVVRLW